MPLVFLSQKHVSYLFWEAVLVKVRTLWKLFVFVQFSKFSSAPRVKFKKAGAAWDIWHHYSFVSCRAFCSGNRDVYHSDILLQLFLKDKVTAANTVTKVASYISRWCVDKAAPESSSLRKEMCRMIQYLSHTLFTYFISRAMPINAY